MEEKTVGQKIKYLLIKNNMKQKELCLKVGITEAAMSRYISNQREPRFDVLVKISNALNVSVSYFIDEDETTKSIKERLLSIDKELNNLIDMIV